MSRVLLLQLAGVCSTFEQKPGRASESIHTGQTERCVANTVRRVGHGPDLQETPDGFRVTTSTSHVQW